MRGWWLLVLVASQGCERNAADIGKDPAKVVHDGGAPMPSTSSTTTAPPSVSSGRDPFKPPDDVGSP